MGEDGIDGVIVMNRMSWSKLWTAVVIARSSEEYAERIKASQDVVLRQLRGLSNPRPSQHGTTT